MVGLCGGQLLFSANAGTGSGSASGNRTRASFQDRTPASFNFKEEAGRYTSPSGPPHVGAAKTPMIQEEDSAVDRLIVIGCPRQAIVNRDRAVP